MLRALFIGFLLLSFSSFAQNATKQITVLVTNEQNLPVENASVTLLNQADSAYLQMQLTDSKGYASINNVVPGKYIIRVTIISYKTKQTFISTGELEGNTVNIVLERNSKSLEVVTVTTKRPLVELQQGKVIVNVEAAISTAGTTALEALEKMPGIAVDKDGNISLKGRTGVMLLVDGKPSYLDAAQLATMLSGMSSSLINQVEIMDQPPAKYDAAGNTGVINIKLKKNNQKGFNGTFSTSLAQGYYFKNTNSLALNYMFGKWNLFANHGYNNNTQFTKIYALRTYFKQDGNTISRTLEQLSFLKQHLSANGSRIGFDCVASNKTSLAILINGSIINRNGESNNPAVWMSSQGVADSQVVTQNENIGKWKNLGASFNFKHSFSATNELTADFDMIKYRTANDQSFQNNIISLNPYLDALRANIPSDINIVSAKADYSGAMNNMKYGAGFKTSHIETDNEANYQYLEGSIWKQDYGKTNHFLYTEDIKAVYLTGETKLDKWSLQAGLRFENTGYDGKQIGNPVVKDSSFSRHYSSLFPTLFTSYEANASNTFSVSIGRRIDRPAFQKLNPFVQVINKYTYQKGNPFYRPQFTWNFQLSHLYKNKLSSSINYSITKDYFSQIFPVDSTGLVIYTEGNLGLLQHFTLSVGYQATPVKGWSLSYQLTGIHKEMEGVIDTKREASINQLNITINNQFQFKKSWSAELSGSYTTRSQNDIQEIVDPAGQLNVGIAKTILKTKGTLKLTGRDLFYTQWMKGNTFFPLTTEYFKLTRDTRVAALSFTYRFGKAFKINKRSEGASGEEVQRVGNG